MCPHGRRFIEGHGGLVERGRIVCHCLLVETSDGLILVDAGFGTADVRELKRRFPLWWRLAIGPRLTEEQTALHQVKALGYKPEDVRSILVTHLDSDHAGGLSDFPHAEVHVYRKEYDAAMARATLSERSRYQPLQWAHGPRWVFHEEGGEQWMDFPFVQALRPKETRVLLVPLIGHTRGHCGVAVQEGERWLLHAGDAYFHHGEVEERRWCPLGLRAFQRIMAIDNEKRERNADRLRAMALINEGTVEIFSAHSPVELARYTERTAVPP